MADTFTPYVHVHASGAVRVAPENVEKVEQ